MLNISIAACTVMFGIMAGFFYAFSGTVMPGLNQISAGSAVKAMQGINFAVRTPHFFVLFFLTPVFSFAIAIVCWRSQLARAALLLAMAGGVYLVFGLILTMTINVPMNEALAIIPSGADSGAIWADYSPDWTFWNHVRTAGSAMSAMLACLALTATRRPYS